MKNHSVRTIVDKMLYIATEPETMVLFDPMTGTCCHSDGNMHIDSWSIPLIRKQAEQ